MKRFVYALAALALVVPGATSTAVAQSSTPQVYTFNALQGEPDNIDPNRSSFATEAAVVRQVFQPLLRFDHNLVPQPAAATSYDVSPDGLTYTFHLDPNGKWSDGTPVTASAFEYSWKRILDPNLAAEYASFVSGAGVVGADDYNSGKVATPDNVGVHAIDDLTLEIDLSAPAGYFPDIAALWVLSPERQDIIQQNGDAWTQDPSTYIGNGPFMMSEWVHQDHISFVPNPNYAGTAPQLQQVNELMVTDNNADYAAYLNGERETTLVPDANVAKVLSDPQLSQEAHRYTELTTFWLNFNTAHTPLNNPLVRKAFSQSIDRDALIRDIAGGVGQPATSFIPPGMPGYQDGLGSDIGFDVAQAKQNLAAAGFSDPSKFPVLNFTYATTTANQTRAEFLQAQLQQNLGVKIQLNPLESKAYQAAFKAKQFDMSFSGWGADYPDPQDWFGTLFGCKGGNNKSNYCNPNFDQAVAQGDGGADLATRLSYYAQAQGVLVSDLPAAPLFYRGRLVLVKPYVQNATITAQDDYPTDLFLDEISIAAH